MWLLVQALVTTARLARSLAVAAATIMLSNLSVSLSGIGLHEQLHVSLLAALGVSPEIAVAISLLLCAHLVVANVIGFAFWPRAPRAVSMIHEAI